MIAFVMINKMHLQMKARRIQFKKACTFRGEAFALPYHDPTQQWRLLLAVYFLCCFQANARMATCYNVTLPVRSIFNTVLLLLH